MFGTFATDASRGGRRSGTSWTRGALAAALLLSAFACGTGDAGQRSDVAVDLAFEPPPAVGGTTCVVTLRDASGAPLAGADVRVEGNMNHAGMVPVFAEPRETEPGRYAGDFEFTMGGDWFVIVSAELADGSRVERTVDVPAVPSKRREGGG